MSSASQPPPLRVEQALRLLPDLDALVPLRALLVATSHPQDPGLSPGWPDRTVGKRRLELGPLRKRLPQALERVSRHLESLYDAAVAALEAEQRGDLGAAVAELVRSGDSELQVGRHGQARLWFDHALRLSEELRDRRPEIRVLLQIARLEQVRGRLDQSARYSQRGLVIAEAESDRASVALACHGLGDVALASAQPLGAETWYARGLSHADDPRVAAELMLGLAEVARTRGQEALTLERIGQARDSFGLLGDSEGLARVLLCEGRFESGRGHRQRALGRFQEALGRLRDTPGRHALEVAVGLEICRIHLDDDRLPDAEDEARRAEELAVAHNLTGDLARLYLLLGTVRGRQGDESGFVFFENAIELCRGLEPDRALEAESYFEYARFRRAIHETEEARAYLSRAREILVPLGESPLLALVQTELEDLPPD